MAVTVADNVLIFTGTTTLAKGTFGPILRARMLQWDTTEAAGAEIARIDDQSGGNTIWKRDAVVAADSDSEIFDAGLDLRAAESAAATGGITVVCAATTTLRVTMGGGRSLA